MSEPTVPRRNDPPSGVNVYSESRAFEVSGRDPNAVYEWANTDPNHPQYAGLKLRKHEIGSPGNYAMCEPWAVVPFEEVVQGKQRADGPSKSFDGSVRNGTNVLLKTTKANRDNYDVVNANEAEKYSRMLADGVRGGTPGSTSTHIRARLGTAADSSISAVPNDVLNGA